MAPRLPAQAEGGVMRPYYSEAGIEIYHGDCREILPTLEADFIFADPPYGVHFKYGVYDDQREGTSLRKGLTGSCGCRKREITGQLTRVRNRTHGMTDSREFRSWRSAKGRCTNPKNVDWENYGGRGITICERWLDSFESFFADMGPRPQNTSLDRIDNEGNYEPGNCRWATPREQRLNSRPCKHSSVMNFGAAK